MANFGILIFRQMKRQVSVDLKKNQRLASVSQKKSSDGPKSVTRSQSNKNRYVGSVNKNEIYLMAAFGGNWKDLGIDN